MKHLFPFLLLFCGGGLAQYNQLANPVIDTRASCDRRYIYFRVNFGRPFQGVIYSEDAFLTCIYVNGSINPRLTYDIEVPLNACQTKRLPNGIYENSIIVQQDRRLMAASDQKFLVNCGPGTSESLDNRFTVSFGGLTVQASLDSTQVVRGRGGSASAVNYQVEVQTGSGPNSSKVQRAVAVGQPISYVVRIRDLLNADATIGMCWANDGISEIRLSDDRGCSLQSTGQVWGNFQSETFGTEKIFWNDIRAWAFPTSNRVNILCNLHLCSGVCSQVGRCRKQRNRRQHSLVKTPSWNEIDEIKEDIIKVEGSFQVTSLKHANHLTASYSHRRRDIQIITADPTEHSNSGSWLCLNQAYFAFGVALLLLTVFLSFLFVVGLGYGSRKCCSGGKRSLHPCDDETLSHWNYSTTHLSTGAPS